MGYRDTATGGTDKRTFFVYSYSFTLDGSKTASSITLPNNPNVLVLALTLLSPQASEIDIHKSPVPAPQGFGPAASYLLSNGQIMGWSGSLTNTQSFQTAIQDEAVNSLVQKEAVPYGVISWTQRQVSGEVNGIRLSASYSSSTNSASSKVQNVSTTFRDDDFPYYTNSFDDPSPDPSVIQVWTDNSFGTYMFRMPFAAPGPRAARFPPPIITGVTRNADGSFTINGQNLFAATTVTLSSTQTLSVIPSPPPVANTSFSIPAPPPNYSFPPGSTAVVTTPNGVSATFTF